MEFLKEFLEQENIELLKEFFRTKKEFEKKQESEEIYKQELINKINENNKFLYVNENVRKLGV